MARRFTLYWSNLKRYEECPQAFLWYRGWGIINLGRGPGRGRPKPVRKTEHHAAMGTIIQAVIENLYNDELWREPKGLVKRLDEMTLKLFDIEFDKRYVDWQYAPTRQEMIDVCLDGVRGYLKTMKAHRFLGEYSKAEIDLLAFVDEYNPIGGRPDMVIRRKDTGITILDGKNAQSKGKYTDPDQLRWYALCFYLAYRCMPDRLGFVYFRYPHGMFVEGADKPEEGVDWVPFTREDLKGIAKRAVDARRAMNKEKFDANPVPKVCRWCEFETVCEPRQRQIESNRRRPKVSSEMKGKKMEGFTEL